MKKSPSRCPCCKTRLIEVFENEYNTYVFDPTSGTYRMHETKGDIDIRCPNCDIKLFDVFPEGVCNYVSRKRKA